MKAIVLVHFLLHSALLWKGTSSSQLFSHAVASSMAPMDVYLGLNEPKWIPLTMEQNDNVTLDKMHVVVTPAKCHENSTKWICFQVHCGSNSIGNSSVLSGECSPKGVQKNYFMHTIQAGEVLTLQIAMCPAPEDDTDGHSPKVESLCNSTSSDCLCMNACLPMWATVRLDAITSRSEDSFVSLDNVPEMTLLLLLHNNNNDDSVMFRSCCNNNNNNRTNTNNTVSHTCAQSAWVLDHIGTIVASAVALLLLGVVVALIGCITGQWRRDRMKQKSFRPNAHNPPSPPPPPVAPPPPPPELEQQEEEEVRYTEQEGTREEEVTASGNRGSYEDVDIMTYSERKNSNQVLVSPPPMVYGSSVTRSTQSGHFNYSQEPGITAMEYEVPLTHADFWHPTPVESEIITYMSQRNMTLIQQDTIKLLEKLGEGEFGCVFHGLWQREGCGGLDVAVKMALDGTCDVDRTKLLQEAAIMTQFSHKNVVMLLGVVRNTENVMIVTEFLCNGDLRLYLKSIKTETTHPSGHNEELPAKLLRFSHQVAQGMKYLSQKAFVHRDLAARNILLDKNYACKIADFGLSRDLAEGDYYTSRGGKIPVKWTAPEALHYHKYTTKSDVWSYGMVLFEIWSLGHKPFEDMTVTQVANLPRNAYCQPPPPGCPRRVYQLMVECWNPDADKRPSFSGIVQYLSQPEGTLLHWSEADRIKSPSRAILGAGLGAGQTLYQDLQQRYSAVTGRKPQHNVRVDTLDERTMLGY